MSESNDVTERLERLEATVTELRDGLTKVQEAAGIEPDDENEQEREKEAQGAEQEPELMGITRLRTVKRQTGLPGHVEEASKQ